MKDKLAEMREQGQIRESKPSFASPCMVVKKKDKNPDGSPRFRFIFDARQLNDATVTDAHPLPSVSDMFDKIGRAKVFCLIDLEDGFHQIPLAEESPHLHRKNSEKIELGNVPFP